jgi:hypothetical protein
LLDELLSVALVGTARAGDAPTPLPEALEAAAATVTDPSPEQRLLTRVALLSAFVRAGRQPIAGTPQSDPSAADVAQPCSSRAADLLLNLIREESKELISEWLSAAGKADRRVPHRLLPDILEAARKDKSLREPVAAVIDHRGRWLMSQNPAWQFATANETPDGSLWETGTPDQRRIVLRQARKGDPARAWTLLRKTWKSDPADDRAEFLKLFAAGLSVEDEPPLENFLDDRSKQVRAVAADLLARLPRSQLVARMTARVVPLLTFKRGLLTGIKLNVTLPAEPDKAAQCDGIDKSPPQGTGEKQWWLQQMVGSVPLSVWSESSGLEPAKIIAAAAENEFSDALLDGLNTAAERDRDPAWIDPLLRQRLAATGRLSRTLLAALSPQQFDEFAGGLLRQKKAGLLACSDLIENQNIPLDLPVARLWVETVADLAGKGGREEWAILQHLPTHCATRLPPGVRELIEARWSVSSEPWVHFRGGVEKLIKVLELRQQIQKEFTV